MARDINLDGAEVTIIKALGFGGSLPGETLIERVSHLADVELIDTLKGLMQLGYIETDHEALQKIEDVEKATFNVNPGYGRELREALDPSSKPKSKRVRRE